MIITKFSGIPCRSVTNYVAALDTNRSFTVDKFFDRDGNEVPNGPDEDCYDSCWNFHAWNDVWMQRPDLPQGVYTRFIFVIILTSFSFLLHNYNSLSNIILCLSIYQFIIALIFVF